MSDGASNDLLAPAVDRNRPWPGLSAFTEEVQSFFHGRDLETDDLYRRLQRKVLTVLFGQSGLGKTSLLQAGLFPMLRRERFLPVLIRLDYVPESPEPAAQVKAAINRALEGTAVTGSNAAKLGKAEPAETLWEYFHRQADGGNGADSELLRLVLIFDQFEEIFTLGASSKESRARIGPFLVELADLIENRTPAALKQRFEEDPDLVERFAFDRHDCCVLFCLREDYLPQLEELRTRLPSVTQNRMRLNRMNGRQALAAVIEPGGGLVTADVARQIVRFVATGRKDIEPGEGEKETEDDLAGLEVEPSLLSLVCRELNERRLSHGLPQITAGLLADSSDSILQDFYERCVADQPPGVRAFVEDELLTESGYRENMALERAEKALAARGAPVAAIGELVKRRLLHLEERLQVQRVELTHDVLTPVIQKSRDERRRLSVVRQAEEREREVREQLRRSRTRLVRTVASMACLLAVISTFLVLSIHEWRRADRELNRAEKNEQEALRLQAMAAQSEQDAKSQRDEATRQRDEANHQRDEANRQRKEAEQQRREAEQQRKVAEAQRKEAEQQKDRATKTEEAFMQYMPDVSSALSSLAGRNRPLLMAYAVVLDISNQQLDRLEKDNPQDIESFRQFKTLNLAAALGVAIDLKKTKDEVHEISKKALTLAEERAKNAHEFANQRAACLAYGIIGDDLRKFGEPDAALDACDKGIAVALGMDAAREERVTHWLAILYQERGDILRAQKQNTEALDAFQLGLKRAEEAAEKKKDDPESRKQIMIICNRIGDDQFDLEHKEEARDAYKRANEIIIALWKENDSFKNRQDLAYSFEKLGNINKALNHFDVAAQAYENQRRTRLAMIPTDLSKLSEIPVDWDYNLEEAEDDLASAYRKIGSLELARGGLLAAKSDHDASRVAFHKAEDAYEKSLDYTKRAADADHSAKYQQSLSYTFNGLGYAAKKLGKQSEARSDYEESLKAIDEAAARDPANDEIQSDRAFALGKLGSILVDDGKIEEAVKTESQRIEILRRLAKAKDDAQSRTDLSEALGSLSFAELFNHQPQQAIAAAEEALKLDPSQLWIRGNLAHGYLFTGQFEQAKAIYEKYQNDKLGETLTFTQAILDDFKRFREAGINQPDMQKIEELLKKPAEKK